MQFGFESEDAYDDNGYGLIFSVITPMSRWKKDYPNLFVQGDLLYTIKDLRDTSSGSSKDYLALTGYMGYKYEWSENTTLTPKIGYSFILGDNDTEMAYGIGIIRKMPNKSWKLVAGWIELGEMRLLSFGTEFSF